MRQGRNTLKILSTYCSNMCQFVFQFNPNFNKCLFLNNSIMKSLIFFSLVSCWGAILGLYSVSMGLLWYWAPFHVLIQFSSFAQSCPTLCNPMNWSMPGFPIHHQLPEPAQTHVHRIGDAIQSSHPLSAPSPPAFNLSQHQGLFQWVSSSHLVAKVLEFQLQHQSFQWTLMTDLL